jgi:phosphoserine aminotransferase
LSSATESWEIIAQSLTENESIHIYNGAFGNKWFEYAKRLKPGVRAIPFDREHQLNTDELVFKTGELICLTQNETSNGSQVSRATIQRIKKNNPDHLIAIDATSSMAGIALDFKSADIWFASVQKCFGLPAGLGIMVCSPAAITRAKALNRSQHYNSLLFLDEMMEKWQTPFTPNVLSIYLLMRVLEANRHIRDIDKTLRGRYKKWESFFDSKSNQLKFLIHNKQVRSHTVLAIEATPEAVIKVKTKALKAGILLGDGYGDLKQSSFRIANFPAIKREEIARLMDFLYGFI